MFEGDHEVKIRNKSYPLLFNTAALREVVSRYGGVSDLGKKLQDDYEKAISEYVWIISLLIRQGVALRNFENETDEKALTVEHIELLLTPKEIFGMQEKIIEVLNEGMDMGTAAEEAEEVDEVLEEILESKNAEGARE